MTWPTIVMQAANVSRRSRSNERRHGRLRPTGVGRAAMDTATSVIFHARERVAVPRYEGRRTPTGRRGRWRGGGRGKSKEATRAREGDAATRTPPLRPHAAAGTLPGRLIIKFNVPTTY
ncbi:hypothetical protein RR48_11371 [Papilio machaon]|uniref:Uncharacterized protein n=1 Tax=Papilio machaon TaxID=76193 RepID=A0A194QMW7_PAPMA|nr:hypothetical protein RR48_11371 [Papilio machaon]